MMNEKLLLENQTVIIGAMAVMSKLLPTGDAAIVQKMAVDQLRTIEAYQLTGRVNSRGISYCEITSPAVPGPSPAAAQTIFPYKFCQCASHLL